MSFFEAVQDWWDSRDIRRIRKRRRKKSASFLSQLKKKEELENDNEEINDIDNGEETLVKSLPSKIKLRGDFFVKKFKNNARWSFIFIASMIAMILFLLAVLFSSDIFSIHNLEFELSNSFFVKEGQIENEMESIIGRNIFMVDTLDLADKLKKKFTTISKIEVKKMFPSSLMISVEEYKPAIILRKGQLQTEEYLLNQAGFVMKQRPYSGLDAEYLVVLSTDQDYTPVVGDQLMSEKTVDFIYRASNLFEEKVGIRIVSIWFLSREHEVHMWSEKYFKVMMSLDRPVEDQIDEMIKALSEFRSYREFEYIDLRIKNKIFIKPR